jgi:hypothetical protein
MTPRNSKSGTANPEKSMRPRRLPPRRRGQGDIEPTVPKSYTLAFNSVLGIRHAAPDYGSQGRALQVASELLWRMRNPPSVASPDPKTLTRMTYKLTPRTIRLIDELARTEYENAGQVIAACLKTLRMRRI